MDGLERGLQGEAEVIRINIQTSLGRLARQELDASFVPTFIVFDGVGHELWRQTGSLPDTERILAEIRR